MSLVVNLTLLTNQVNNQRHIYHLLTGSNATLLSTGIQMSPNALWAFMWINKSLYLGGTLPALRVRYLGVLNLLHKETIMHRTPREQITDM